MTGADATAILAGQRAELRQLVAELRSAPPVAPERTGPELRRRQGTVRRLRQLFAAHESVNLSHVWPLARRRAPAAAPVIRDSIALKKQIEESMVKLDWVGDRDHAANLETDLIVPALERLLLAEEGLEAQVWQALDGAERADLGRRLRRALVLAPTRTHPDLPANPAIGRMIAPVVGIVDRIRDALSAPVQAT